MVVSERKDTAWSALHHIRKQHQSLADYFSKCANYNCRQNDHIVVNCYYGQYKDRKITVKHMIHFDIKRWFHVIVHFKDLLE